MKFPALTDKQVIKKLRKLGFISVRHKGSHERWLNPETGVCVTVPRHARKVLKRKTLKSIIDDTGLSVEEFSKL